MDAEEVTKLVDGVYKNILEKFNPGTRQLITAGKGYLKALQGAASASRLFNEALAKIAMNAQQSGTNDIGAALMNVVSVYKEIQDQQINTLKAFYADVLVPLETNLEKDTKVIQHEQKKFMQQHKVRMESYQKAVSTMKKQRKKKATPENTEKELRSLQLLEDQKKKLDAFCEQSYKNAMTQERRRYGFVLERQCSIAKHWMAYHSTGRNAIDGNLKNWAEIAASREIIPAAAFESTFNGIGSKRMERIKDIDDSHAMGGSNGNLSQLKKARSVDAPYGDMRTLHESSTSYAQNSLPRAKSDFNLTTATSVASNEHVDHHGHWDQRPVVKALYAYMPSGENQLPFEEGDSIALVGSKAKGWQFGENLRTQLFGWFPIAYTNAADLALDKRHASIERERNDRYENMHYERNSRGGGGGAGGAGGGGGSSGMRNSYQDHSYMAESHLGSSDNVLESDLTYRRRNNSAEESSPTRMFGDTINFRNQKKYRASTGANPRPGPPPTLPAPVPSVSQTSQSRILNSSQSFCAPNGAPSVLERRKHKAQAPHSSSMGHMTGNAGNVGGGQAKSATAAKTSLHSSNDSGFANEPPPQPEIDYSDEEQASRVPIRRRAETNAHGPREVASWTLNRNFRSSVDSQIDDKSLSVFGKSSGNPNGNGKMRYDLIASDDEILHASSSGIKRTKSFWKFGGGRSDDILVGMSLWQHRDLVAAPNLDELRSEDQQQQQQQQKQQQPTRRDDSAEAEHDRIEREDREYDSMDKNGTLTKSNSNNSSAASSRNEKHRKDSTTSLEVYDDEENIYGISPVDIRKESQAIVQQQSQQRNSMSAIMHANYTPKSRMKIMKTIEIDIENPTENERLSTLKRGQKDYNRDINMLQNQHQHQQQQQQSYNNSNNNNHKSKQQHQQQQQPKQSQRTNNKGSGSGGHSGSGSGSGLGLGAGTQQQKNSTAQMKSSQQANGRIKSSPHDSMAMHSTEDEDASDDNGTLKMSDVNNFFDDIPHDGINAAGMIMKTVKRKDILKQYYTSEDEESDDVEVNSTSSDPYDCIVINDHLVRKDEKYRRQQNLYHQEQQMEFQTFRSTTTKATSGGGNDIVGTNKSAKKLSSKQQPMQQQQQQKQQQHQQKHHPKDSEQRERYNGNSATTNGALNTPTATILPRTRLMKSSSSTLERTTQQKSTARSNDGGNGSAASAGNEKERLQYSNKTYGPWYDFWDQQDHHTLVSQKSMNNSKMK